MTITSACTTSALSFLFLFLSCFSCSSKKCVLLGSTATVRFYIPHWRLLKRIDTLALFEIPVMSISGHGFVPIWVVVFLRITAFPAFYDFPTHSTSIGTNVYNSLRTHLPFTWNLLSISRQDSFGPRECSRRKVRCQARDFYSRLSYLSWLSSFDRPDIVPGNFR